MCVLEKEAKGKKPFCPGIRLPQEYRNAEMFLKEFLEKICEKENDA